MGAAGATLMVDPAPLNAGVYEVVVTVTDDGEPRETAAARLRLRVVASLPALGAEDTDADGASDASEGYGDSDLDGLADYRDASVPANALPAQGPDAGGALVEADAGLSLRLGPTAFAAEQPGAIVSEEMIAQFAPGGRKDDLPNVGGYFSFTVSGLPNGGDSARIVVPQRDAIPERPVYRKLSAVAGWRDFVTDAGNRLASAPGGSGLCPPPADPAYQPGLTPGHWCVRLTVEDGGPNDSDGRADTLITDPGGVGQDSASNTVAGNGGGGSLGWLMLALLGWFGCAGACSGYPRPGERVGPELVRG
jgi:hypothetical protein